METTEVEQEGQMRKCESGGRVEAELHCNTQGRWQGGATPAAAAELLEPIREAGWRLPPHRALRVAGYPLPHRRKARDRADGLP